MSLAGSDAEAGYRGPFEGWIVDADTKEPVEGVVVFVEWVQAHLMDSGGIYVDAAETQTDAEGYFAIPSWWSFNPLKNFLTAGLVTIFKSGYQPIAGGYWDRFLEIEWGAPKGTFIWKFRRFHPIILLHKASDGNLRRSNFDRLNPHGSKEKTVLIRREMDKEDAVLFPDKNR